MIKAIPPINPAMMPPSWLSQLHLSSSFGFPKKYKPVHYKILSLIERLASYLQHLQGFFQGAGGTFTPPLPPIEFGIFSIVNQFMCTNYVCTLLVFLFHISIIKSSSVNFHGDSIEIFIEHERLFQIISFWVNFLSFLFLKSFSPLMLS